MSLRSARRSLALVIGVAVIMSACGRPTRLAAPDRLARMRQAYHERYLVDAAAARDPLRSNHVTSEAQSYLLLQAVWMHDRAGFDRVLQWTTRHLVRPDHLVSWLYDPATQRVIDVNTATDADIDIAFALSLASVAFEDAAYGRRAAEMVRAMRTVSSIPVREGWFLTAGNWANDTRIINLSYFAPYAFRYFDALEPDKGWPQAIETGYSLIDQALARSPTALPADFNSVSREGRLADVPVGHEHSRDFSYDAIRIVWRLEMTCRLQQDVRACDLASRLAQRLVALEPAGGRLVSRYGIDGAPLPSDFSASVYGALLPTVARTAPETAERWRSDVLSDYALDDLMTSTKRYYDANWVWFGLGLAEDVLIQRTASSSEVQRRLR